MARDRHYDLYEVLGAEYRALRPDAPEVASPNNTASDNEQDSCARLGAVQQRMLDDNDGLTALCLSGGGIRSATFGLGVVQGLAKLGLLERFDYLSTVSGGGYLGSWLTAWAQRHEQGMAGVSEALRKPQRPGTPAEPEEVRHLREYSNYLAPRLGPLSVDTWTLISTYLRNLTLNWLVIIPLLCVVLLIPRIYIALLTETIPLPVLFLVGSMIMGLMWVGLRYVGMDRPSAGGLNRDQQAFLRGCLLPLGVAVLLISLCWAWIQQLDDARLHWLADGWVISVVATLVYLGTWSMHLVKIRAKLRGRLARKKLREAVAAIVSGGSAGALVWVWTQLFDATFATSELIAVYACCAAPALWMAFTLAESIFVGLSSRLTGEDDREWWARSGAWILIAMCSWIVLCVTVIYGPELLLWLWRRFEDFFAAAGMATGALTVWAARNNARKRDAQSASAEATEADIDLQTRIAGWVLKFTAPLLVLSVLILLAYVTDLVLGLPATNEYGVHLDFIKTTGMPVLSLFLIVALMLSGIMARFINVNRFSLHAMYRNRLIRAYLGASHRNTDHAGHVGEDECDTLHPFTGFDEQDNLHMHELWPNAKFGDGKLRRMPLLVVNIALNLVRGQRLAWQQRKAASFTVTPLHAGGCCVGYRPVGDYGGDNGMSLGTAMTISGAAASPNMGYHTTGSLSFLMGLFNARLGWWLGNPSNEETWRKKGPDFSVTPLVDEMLGLTSENNPWVYLSDGGHFDNLGLYEMVQRRCRLIVISDAGADPCGTFEDLGNALRKIRADLGVSIELESKTIDIGSRGQGQTEGHYCALFRIDYPASEGASKGLPQTGQILYLKPAVYGGEPMDIVNYAREHPLFPHEPTSDQFFAESQFESYRRLGEFVVERLVADSKKPVTTLEGLIAAGRRHCGLDS